MNKDLHILCAHLDDFEISCNGYIFKHHKQYENIYIHVATNNDHKEPITIENLQLLNDVLTKGTTIHYKQHNFHSTRLRSEMDDLNILSHDSNDLHTDHQVCYEIMMGLLKLSDNFITYYSPSSLNFEPNYFIELSKTQYKFKTETIGKYDIEKDQSYTKVGYYLNEHWNIGMAYVMENCAKYKSEYYDIYKIKKWTTNGDS